MERKNNISKLLRQYLSGDPGCDLQSLKKELEKPENVDLQQLFTHLNELDSSDLVADEQKMWSQIETCKDAGKNKHLVFRSLFKYAAVILLLLLPGGIWLMMDKGRDETVVLAESLVEIGPGKTKAVLILAGGEQVNLPAAGQDTILLREGAKIVIDASKTVSYQQAKSSQPETVFNRIVVPRAGEYRLILADGTVVWLNSDSELKFPVAFAGHQRKVYLKGEAYFQVIKDVERPFLVEVGDMSVEVLGTEFNINAYSPEGKIQTTLVKGRVRVENELNNKTVMLKPNQQAEFSNGRLSVKEIDVSVYTSWIHGKFYFEEVSLEEIAAQLQRWYDIDFFFAREELKGYEFTGVISRNYPADQILEIIEKTTDVKFEIKGRVVTVR